MAKDLNLDDISIMIANSILSEKIINKKRLPEVIKPIIKILIRDRDSVKRVNNKTEKQRLIYTIEKKEFEQKYWRNKVKALVGDDNIKQYYRNLENSLIKEGFNN